MGNVRSGIKTTLSRRLENLSGFQTRSVLGRIGQIRREGGAPLLSNRRRHNMILLHVNDNVLKNMLNPARHCINCSKTMCGVSTNYAREDYKERTGEYETKKTGRIFRNNQD